LSSSDRPDRSCVEDLSPPACIANEWTDALAAGVFGPPSFLIDRGLFWGNDRRRQPARTLALGPI
jgi:2-hydroxychromene-2-carboxylate isomerase